MIDPTKPCPHCQGHGTRPVYRKRRTTEGAIVVNFKRMEPKRVLCRTCNGTGRANGRI